MAGRKGEEAGISETASILQRVVQYHISRMCCSSFGSVKKAVAATAVSEVADAAG